MKKIVTVILVLAFSGCAAGPFEKTVPKVPRLCSGTSNLPANLADKFEPIEDKPLLEVALGNPNEGKLCQGQVYISKAYTQVAVFRAWNSTNPKSEFGKWWAFHPPTGKISEYRKAYEICYQWSPLDKLVSCTLKPGVKVVVGTGQSAVCSAYLTYPVSDKQQLFLEDAAMSVTNCTLFDGHFSWK